jgi:hypothetical protein
MGKVGLHARALLLVVAARVLLERRDTTVALRRLARRSPRRLRPLAAEDAVVAVQRAGRMAQATCLAQSIALAALFERAGEEASLVLGCRLYEDRHWGAHAWVVVNGTVWEPVPAGAHEELAELDAAHAWIPRPRG